MVGPVHIPEHADNAIRQCAFGAPLEARLCAMGRPWGIEGRYQLRKQGHVRGARQVMGDRATPNMLVRFPALSVRDKVAFQARLACPSLLYQ